MPRTYFDDPQFQTTLIALLCRDTVALRSTDRLISGRDFRPLSNHDSTAKWRWVIAQIALEYWKDYREPIGDMLRSSLLAYCAENRITAAQRKGLLLVGHNIYRRSLIGANTVLERTIRYRKEHLRAEAVQEIINLQSSGELDDAKWQEIYERVLTAGRSVSAYDVADFFSELDQRIGRRSANRNRRYPMLFIEPLDSMVRTISFGHLGLVMAPYKKGKSLALIWFSLAYCLQGLNVMHVTLEDPKEDVEDRFDAACSGIPIKALRDEPSEVRRKFSLFRRNVRSHLKIVDGTTNGMKIKDIVGVMQQEREKGFLADVLIIDYDDEIIPPRKQSERRFEFADIYRDLRQVAAKYNVILWTAAQTQRGTEEKMIVKANTIAEDISKPRKVTMALSIGSGPWGDNSRHLYVAAHKFDTMNVGCDIMNDLERMVFYDHSATMRAIRADRKKAKQNGAL